MGGRKTSGEGTGSSLINTVAPSPVVVLMEGRNLPARVTLASLVTGWGREPSFIHVLNKHELCITFQPPAGGWR